MIGHQYLSRMQFEAYERRSSSRILWPRFCKSGSVSLELTLVESMSLESVSLESISAESVSTEFVSPESMSVGSISMGSILMCRE